MTLEIASIVDQPVGEGWDESSQITYATPPAEQRLVFALARRKGSRWFIALIDGTQRAADRRASQGLNALSSLEVKGLEKESFVGRKANKLDAERIAELDRFIEESRSIAKVPGVAVAAHEQAR